MENIMKKSLSVPSTILVSLCYCYFISLRIPKGFLRLISLLPVLYHFIVLPLYLSPGFFLVLETTLFAWPSSLRLLLFAFGQGPLSAIQTSQSLYHFIVYAALPIRNPTSKLPSQSKKKLPLLLVAIAIIFMVKTFEHVHPKLLLAAYFVHIWIYMDFVRSSLNVVLHSLLGLELEQSFDEPYETTSLQDFWGKRWNLTVSDLLRQVVFNPVKSASVAFVGNDLAIVGATLATFTTSGLIHELQVYCFTLAKPSWEMTGYFVLHGIFVVLEVRLKSYLKGRRLDLPWYISMPLTLGFVFLTCFWLYFPPLVRNGVDVMVAQELQYLTTLLMRLFVSLGVTK